MDAGKYNTYLWICPENVVESIWYLAHQGGCYLVCRMEGKVENQTGMKWKDFGLVLGGRRQSEATRWGCS